MTHFYRVRTRSGLECVVESDTALSLDQIKAASYSYWLDNEDDYDAGDRFVLIEECDGPLQVHTRQDGTPVYHSVKYRPDYDYCY